MSGTMHEPVRVLQATIFDGVNFDTHKILKFPPNQNFVLYSIIIVTAVL